VFVLAGAPEIVDCRLLGKASRLSNTKKMRDGMQQAPDPRVADLVQAGRLRVWLGPGSPALAINDPATGEVRGPALDLVRSLAARIGIEVQPVEYPRPSAIMEGVPTNAWDVTFLGGWSGSAKGRQPCRGLR
jgi:ABC-type amino acid transport substrate-binding protein